ncbi:hypothetical protein ACIPPM_04150 [Streptomyces sp. NPDC090119]|uniref:hypothetical protein n=1 Tax=Streptomyces sp. NPDC090119 TaxID=3365951 RepID=UPI0038298ED6
MVESAEYDEAAPRIREYLERFERAVAQVRLTHGDRPVDEVRLALAEAFASECLVVWSEVTDDAARRIAEAGSGESFG